MRLQTLPLPATLPRIDVDVRAQQLRLALPDGTVLRYPVSTAANGTGCRQGSYCTPTGRHRVRLKIGEGCVPGTVFHGRRATGEVFGPELAQRFPARDWILTRILWLEGLEPGHNRGGSVDSLRRYVYIHGTADEHLIGQPASHGCIRMRGDDLVALFDRVPAGTPVRIA
ncbi:L,D-transpeptidase [Ramlibacter pallidus]|uniref:L,D-transpeptidase n=1 Tax=Ramlibacter pallidus TaxID=2780087 RepID=A0ABR9S203_9BURK|nr:L,D-transpeptidase [Ramlibacter pallidus]MBE7367539.1 L,D-transpeptidase [Ramlibacter pallidus]